MTTPLDRRAAHLARTFQLVALTLGVPGLWVACSKSDGAPTGPADASTADTSVPGDGTADASGARDAAGDDAPSDASDASEAAVACWASISAIDGGPDAEELCEYVLPCGLASSNLAPSGCRVFPADPDGGPIFDGATGFPYCRLLEGKGCTDGGYDPPATGVSLECVGCPSGGGRRPAGYRRARGRGARTTTGAYFAEMARLESSSVRAFEVLAGELGAHGAPPALVDLARVSARDETRHAAAMADLARRFGGDPCAAPVPRFARRSLAAIARENAVEGCVRETFGALVNAWQATHAGDPEVRAAMTAIARDELRHAALSWQIAAWIDRALAPSTRRSIARSQRRAAARLVSEATREAPPELRALAGLPDAREGRALAKGLVERLELSRA